MPTIFVDFVGVGEGEVFTVANAAVEARQGKVQGQLNAEALLVLPT